MLHITNDRRDLQPFQLGVDCMKSTHQMFEEEFKCLRQAQHGLALYHEGCDLLAPIFHNFTLVGRGVIGGHGRGRTVIAKAAIHELVHEIDFGGRCRPRSAMGPSAESGMKERWRMSQHGGHRGHRHGS